jgi:hypothetical protein
MQDGTKGGSFTLEQSQSATVVKMSARGKLVVVIMLVIY